VEKNRQKILDLLIVSALAMILYWILQNLFFLIFPIVSAFLFSEMIRKSFRRLHPLSNGVKKTLIILVLLIFFSFLSLLVILFTERLIRLIASFSGNLNSYMESVTLFIQEKTKWAESFFSNLLKKDFENRLQNSLPALLRQFLEKIADRIPQWIGALMNSVPKFFISFFIFSICTYYFSGDWEHFSAFFKKRIKKEKLDTLRRFRERFLRGLTQYLKAYLLLFLLTFSMLFLGFSCLHLSSPAEKAFYIAFVDLLPVFGCGTVLIPWALFSFFLSETGLAIGLLVLYVIIFAIRQILEPKIVGESIGIHPVFSLILVIGGLYLFGFSGMILLPLIATCAMNHMEEA